MEWEDSLQNNTTIDVGQNLKIPCNLETLYPCKHVNECFQFGIKRHNHSFANVSIHTTSGKQCQKNTLNQWTTIKYWYDITNASLNDTGVYTCYYIKNFPSTGNCPGQTVQHFNVIVRGEFFPLIYNTGGKYSSPLSSGM